MKRIAKKTINFILILLFLFCGFVGLALPLVPQAVFFAIAVILITFEIPSLENWIISKLTKYPEIQKLYISLRDFLARYLK
jgi:uncharacterized membrane protein YbaN (DUF454 family)